MVSLEIFLTNNVRFTLKCGRVFFRTQSLLLQISFEVEKMLFVIFKFPAPDYVVSVLCTFY
jgi:hypothetical protein